MNRLKRRVLFRSPAVLLALIACLPLFSACGREDAPLQSNVELDSAVVQLIDKPSESNNLEHEYEIRLRDVRKQAYDVDSVKLTLTMTMKDGMRHSKSGMMTRSSEGVYTLRLKLPMEGRWTGAVLLRKGDYGRTVTRFAED